MNLINQYSIQSFKIIMVVLSILLLGGCAGNMIKTDESVDQVDDIEMLEQKAAQLYRSGDKDEALIEYVNIINIDPRNENAYMKIGRIHESLKSYQLAEMAYKSVLEINPENVAAREGLGISMLKQGNHNEAEVILADLVTYYPDRWRSHNGLGVIYDIKKMHSKAISHFKKADELNPNNAEIANNIGYAYYLNGDWEQAKQYFLIAIQLDNSFERAWSNMGLLYARRQEYKQSVSAFEHVMEKHEAWNQVGYLAMISGDYEASELQLKKAILIAPFYYEDAHKNLTRLEILKGTL